jgi:hypothetical protein
MWILREWLVVDARGTAGRRGQQRAGRTLEIR